MTDSLTAVTGATGAIGSRVARRLARLGVPLRLVARQPDRQEQHRTAVDSALQAGVRRIVYLSFIGAAADATFTFARDHWATEQHIRTTSAAFTFLRSGLYGDDLPSWVGADNTIRGPASDGAASWTARDDIADVATHVLLDPAGHEGTYDVTGPEALTMHEVADALTHTLRRPVSYVPETLDEARDHGVGREPKTGRSRAG